MKVTKAVITAAGFGTRMLPAAKSVPKPMLPIVDKPAIQYIVEEAVASGITDILIVIGRGQSILEDHFDYAPELEARLSASGREPARDALRAVADMAAINFIRQQETKGFGHAVWRAKSFVGDQPFAVLSGDDIMRAEVPVTKQLTEVAEREGAAAVGVQAVTRDAIGKYCTSEVELLRDNVYRVTKLIEKPRPEQVMSLLSILGRYVLTPDIFDILEALPPGHGGEIQLTDAINALCGRRPVLAVDFAGKRYDTGNVTGYLETILDFALERPDIGPWLREKYKL
jgi:UTP--glucose-1-phosphate uridylyltransferase